MKKDLELVTICVTYYQQAIIIKSRLESERIPVFLDYETMGPGWMGGIFINGLGEVRIKVPARYAKRAREILEELGLE